MTPDAATLRRKILPYMSSETTPSWMRAPAPSLMPIMGTPAETARSMALCTFSAKTSPNEPP